MSVMTTGKGLTAAESNAYVRGVAAGKREREDALTTIIKELEAERDALKTLNAELVEALERINLRFYNFDNQHPSLCTNEAARQLLAEIEADIAGALAKVRP